MNTMKKIYIIVSLILANIFYSCEVEDVRENPNYPTDVPLSVLLPPAQSGMASSTMNELSPITGLFMQYFEGTTHFEPISSYQIDNSFYIQDIWSDFYTDAMITLKTIIDKAEEENSPHYSGIAKTLMALGLGSLSSSWGNVPYSDALNGQDVLKPAFDDQSEIYNSIQTLLAEAITELQTVESTNTPGADDVIYNGDLEMWIKTAYALKARYYLHVVKRSSELSYNPLTEAMTAISNSFIEYTEDCQYSYGYSAVELNPYSTGKNSTDILVSDVFYDLINDSDDPRKDLLATRSFGENKIGDFYGSEGSPCLFITYSELKFIEAEVRLRLNTADAEISNALAEAISSNITKVTENDPDMTQDSIDNYVQSVVNLTGNFNTDLETIMNQKYIAMFSQPESWSDYRRTGFPVLTPDPDGDLPQNPGGGIPRRLPYPQNEIDNNTQNVPENATNLQDRVWWDVE